MHRRRQLDGRPRKSATRTGPQSKDSDGGADFVLCWLVRRPLTNRLNFKGGARVTKSRSIGRGDRRAGSGRKRGSHNRSTVVMLAEPDRYRDPEVEDVLPSVFMKRVMNDESAPLTVRIMCAAKVLPFCRAQAGAGFPGEMRCCTRWSSTGSAATAYAAA